MSTRLLLEKFGMHYLIDLKKAADAHRPTSNRFDAIQPRPSSWKTFLSAFIRANRHIAFVEVPDDMLRAFHHRTKAFWLSINGDKILINGNWYPVKPWTLGNLCHFCLEGLQTGTFWRFWRWRW